MSIAEGTKVRLHGNSKWARMGVWEVVKVNPTKYKLALSTDAGVILNAPHSMVYEVQGSEGPQGPKRPEGLRVGAVVQMPVPVAEFDEFTLWVVIKDEITMVHIVPLGGDSRGRYWKMLPGRMTVVDLSGKQQ